jgi:hypothetical protein
LPFAFFISPSVMATIHLARNQQSLGPFGEEELREGLRTGRFLSTDLVWRVGMEGWKPLGEMAPLWGLETPPPPLDPLATASVESAVQTAENDEPAWEQREKIGFFPALSQTISGVLMRPTETFSKMKQEGGLVNPLLYYVILGCVSGVVLALYQMGLQSQMGDFESMIQQYAPQYHLPPHTFDGMAFGSAGFLGSLLLIPAGCVLRAFLGAAIFHLMLMIVGGANRPFETTFRVYCYAFGTSMLFNLLPCCGALIGIIWGSYILYVGLKEAHGIEGWKSLVAISLPGFLCCILPLILGIAGFAAYYAKDGLPH